MEDVLIVGAGITGAVTASMLRGQLPSSTRITLWDKAHGAGQWNLNFWTRPNRSAWQLSDVYTRDSIRVWQVGAWARVELRLTSTAPTSTWARSTYRRRRPISTLTRGIGCFHCESKCWVSFICCLLSTDLDILSRLYEELLSQKVLEPLSASIEGDRSSADTKHFVTPDGVSSLVKHFLGKSGWCFEADLWVCPRFCIICVVLVARNSCSNKTFHFSCFRDSLCCI